MRTPAYNGFIGAMHKKAERLKGTSMAPNLYHPPDSKARHAVHVKELGDHDRYCVRKHFLLLDRDGRALRFGNELQDEQVSAYVEGLDFERDTLYGVYNNTFQLVAVAHLAFVPKASMPDWLPTGKDTVAEFGVSVLDGARGVGIGSQLFERAAIHCRNKDVDTLHMQCLTTNAAMMHIAKKAGMELQRDHGESDACLRLRPASTVSVLQEAMQEQLATIDYAIKSQAHATAKLFKPPERKPAAPDEDEGKGRDV